MGNPTDSAVPAQISFTSKYESMLADETAIVTIDEDMLGSCSFCSTTAHARIVFSHKGVPDVYRACRSCLKLIQVNRDSKRLQRENKVDYNDFIKSLEKGV